MKKFLFDLFPLILFFLAAQRQFIATMTFTGLKG